MSMSDQVTNYENTKNETDDEKLKKQDVIPTVNNRNGEVMRALDNPNENFIYKISLRSKAEEEIVNEAKRKKALEEMCEQNELTEHNLSSYSLARLRGLRVLQLGSCYKVSDVSLKYNFKLPELKEVNFSRCQQVGFFFFWENVK